MNSCHTPFIQEKPNSGMYILLADDTEPGYHTDNAAWQPLLHPYQQVPGQLYNQVSSNRYC